MKWWLIALLSIVVLGLVWYIWAYMYTTPKVEGFQTTETQIIPPELVYPSTGNLASTTNSYVIYDPTAAYLQANIYAIEYALPLIQIYLEDKNFTDTILPKFLIELKEPTSFVNNLNAEDTAPPYLLKSDKVTKDRTIITQDVLRNLANFNVKPGATEINTEDPPKRNTPLIKNPPTAFYKARDLSFMTDYNLSSGFINNPVGLILSGVKPLTTNIHCGWRTLDVTKITTRMMYNNYNIYTRNGNPAIIGDEKEWRLTPINNLGLTPFDMFDSARYMYPESTIQNTSTTTETNPSTCNPYLPAPYTVYPDMHRNNYQKLFPCNFLADVFGWKSWIRDTGGDCWEDPCAPNLSSCGGCGCIKASMADGIGFNRKWKSSDLTPCNVSKFKNLYCARIPGEATTTLLNAITKTNIFTNTTIQPTSYMKTPSNTVTEIISNFNTEKGTGSKIHKTVSVVGTINSISTAEAQKSAYYAMYFNFTDPSTTDKQILVSSTSPCKLYMSPTASAANEFYSPKSSPGTMDISGTAVAHNKIHCNQEITSDILRLLPFQTREFIRRWAIGRRTRIQTWYQQKCLTFAPTVNTGEAATIIAAALVNPGVTFLDNTQTPPGPRANTKMLPAQSQLSTRGVSMGDNPYKAYLYNISTLNTYCYANPITESTASRNNPANFSINNPYTVVFANTQSKSNIPCNTQDIACTTNFLSGIQTSCETSEPCYTPARSTTSEKTQTVYTSSGSTNITISYPPLPINTRTYKEPYTSADAVAPKFDMQSNPNISPTVFVTQTTTAFTPSFTIYQAMKLPENQLVNQPGQYTIDLTIPTTPVGIDSFVRVGASLTVESALTPTSFFSGTVKSYAAGALKLHVRTNNVYINYVKQGTETQVTSPWNPPLPNDKYIISFTDPQTIDNNGSESRGAVTLFPIKINPNKVSKIIFSIPLSEPFSNLPPTPPTTSTSTTSTPPPITLNVIVSKFSNPAKYFNGTAVAYDPSNTSAKLTVNVTAQAIDYDNTDDHYSIASNYLISRADTTTPTPRTYLFREEKQQIMNMIAQKYYDLSLGAVVMNNIQDVYQVGDTLFDVRFSDTERDPAMTAQIQAQIAAVRSDYERNRTLNLKDDEFLSLESNYTDQMITLNAALNSAVRGTPDETCGINARYIVVKRTDGTLAAPVRVELSQIVVIDSTGNNVAYNAQIIESKADVYEYENPDAYAHIFPDDSTLESTTGIVKNSNTIINDPNAATVTASRYNFPISSLSTITNGNVVVLKKTGTDANREPANIKLIKMNRSLTLVDGILKPRIKPYYYYGISSGNEFDNTIVIDLGSTYDITNVQLIFPAGYTHTSTYAIGFLDSGKYDIVLPRNRMPAPTSGITYEPAINPKFIKKTISPNQKIDFRVSPESRIDCPVTSLNPYKVARFYADIATTFSNTASPQTNIRALTFTGYSLGQSAALTFNPMYNAGFTLSIGAGGGNMNYIPSIVYTSNSVTPSIGTTTITPAPTQGSSITINVSGQITSIPSAKLNNTSVILRISDTIFFKGTIRDAANPTTSTTNSRSITINPVESITGILPATGTYAITLSSGNFYAGMSTTLCTDTESLKNILKDYMAYIGTNDFQTRADIEPLVTAGDYDISQYRFYPQKIIGSVKNGDGSCGIKWTEKKIDPITNQNMTLIGESGSSTLITPSVGSSHTFTLVNSIPPVINIVLGETRVTVRDANNSSNTFNGIIRASTAAGSITIDSVSNIKGKYTIASTYEIYGGTYTRWGKFAYIINKETWAATDAYCDVAKSVIYTSQANYSATTENSTITELSSPIQLTQLLPIEAQSLETVPECGAAKCSDIPVIHSLVQQYNENPENSAKVILRVTNAVTTSPNSCEFTAYTQGNNSPAYITMNVSANNWNSTEACSQQTYTLVDALSSTGGTFIESNTPILTQAYNYVEQIMAPYRDMLTNAKSGVVPTLSTIIQKSAASSTLTTYRADTYGAYGKIKDLSGCAPNSANASCGSQAVINEFVKTYNSKSTSGSIMTEVTHAGTATAAGEKTCDFIGTIKRVTSAPNGNPVYDSPQTVGIRATMEKSKNSCYFKVDTTKDLVDFTSQITNATFQNLQTVNSLPGVSAQVAGNPIFLGSVAPRTIGIISSATILPVNNGSLNVTIELPPLETDPTMTQAEKNNIMSILLKKTNLPITVINQTSPTIQFTGVIGSYDEITRTLVINSVGIIGSYNEATNAFVINSMNNIYPPNTGTNTGAYNAAYNRPATYEITTVYYIGGQQQPPLPDKYTTMIPRISEAVSLPVTDGTYTLNTVVTVIDAVTPSNVFTGKISSITATTPKILTISSISSKKGNFVGAYNSYIIYAYALEGVPGALNKDAWSTPMSLGLPSNPVIITPVLNGSVPLIVEKNSSLYKINTLVLVTDTRNSSNSFKGKIIAYIANSGNLTIANITNVNGSFINSTQYLVSETAPLSTTRVVRPVDTVDFVDCKSLFAFNAMGIPPTNMMNNDSITCQSKVNDKIYKFSQAQPGASLIVTVGKENSPYIFPTLTTPLSITIADAQQLYPYIDVNTPSKPVTNDTWDFRVTTEDNFPFAETYKRIQFYIDNGIKRIRSVNSAPIGISMFSFLRSAALTSSERTTCANTARTEWNTKYANVKQETESTPMIPKIIIGTITGYYENTNTDTITYRATASDFGTFGTLGPTDIRNHGIRYFQFTFRYTYATPKTVFVYDMEEIPASTANTYTFTSFSNSMNSSNGSDCSPTDDKNTTNTYGYCSGATVPKLQTLSESVNSNLTFNYLRFKVLSTPVSATQPLFPAEISEINFYVRKTLATALTEKGLSSSSTAAPIKFSTINQSNAGTHLTSILFSRANYRVQDISGQAYYLYKLNKDGEQVCNTGYTGPTPDPTKLSYGICTLNTNALSTSRKALNSYTMKTPTATYEGKGTYALDCGIGYAKNNDICTATGMFGRANIKNAIFNPSMPRLKLNKDQYYYIDLNESVQIEAFNFVTGAADNRPLTWILEGSVSGTLPGVVPGSADDLVQWVPLHTQNTEYPYITERTIKGPTTIYSFLETNYFIFGQALAYQKNIFGQDETTLIIANPNTVGTMYQKYAYHFTYDPSTASSSPIYPRIFEGFKDTNMLEQPDYPLPKARRNESRLDPIYTLPLEQPAISTPAYKDLGSNERRIQYLRFTVLETRGNTQNVAMSNLIFTTPLGALPYNHYKITNHMGIHPSAKNGPDALSIQGGYWASANLQPLLIRFYTLPATLVEGFQYSIPNGRNPANTPSRWRLEASYDGRIWETYAEQLTNMIFNGETSPLYKFRKQI